MLTCLNPDVAMEKERCMAVSLKWFIPLLQKTGDATPSEETIKSEIKLLEIGAISKKRQHFNKTPDSVKISRAAGATTKTTPRACVIVKHSAFNEDNWSIFSSGNYI